MLLDEQSNGRTKVKRGFAVVMVEGSGDSTKGVESCRKV